MTTKKTSRRRKTLPTISDERLRVLMAADELMQSDALVRWPRIRVLAMGLARAKSTIHGHLIGLRDDGLIEGEPYKIRGYWLTPLGEAVVEAARERGVCSGLRPGFAVARRTPSEQDANS